MTSMWSTEPDAEEIFASLEPPAAPRSRLKLTTAAMVLFVLSVTMFAVDLKQTWQSDALVSDEFGSKVMAEATHAKDAESLVSGRRTKKHTRADEKQTHRQARLEEEADQVDATFLIDEVAKAVGGIGDAIIKPTMAVASSSQQMKQQSTQEAPTTAPTSGPTESSALPTTVHPPRHPTKKPPVSKPHAVNAEPHVASQPVLKTTTHEPVLEAKTSNKAEVHTPSPTVDPWFPPVNHYSKDAKTHNEQFIKRASDFDTTVSREKGIILCLLDRLIPIGLSLIKEIRCLGNQEIIQVYHCLPEELSDENVQLILSQDRRVEIIDACSDLVHANVLTHEEAKTFKSFWSKPLAVHHTNVKEVIVLDADDILMQNPDIVRQTPGYKQHGTMFFYDHILNFHDNLVTRLGDRNGQFILHFIVENMDYAAFGLSGPKPSQHLLDSFAYRGETSHEQDSSMVVIDKTRAGKAMDVLWWIITKLRIAHGKFSWGDKEDFWLAYELAQVPYAFSPWGVSGVSSFPNNDMGQHPDTLCGSIAQYLPTDDSSPADLLYINGRALLDPYTQGIDTHNYLNHLLYNARVTHIVPRQVRKAARSYYGAECLGGHGSTPVPPYFQKLLFRRRMHYAAIVMGLAEPLAMCEFEPDALEGARY